MEYFGNPSSQAVRDAMTAGRIGMITTPRQGNRIRINDPKCVAKTFPDYFAVFAQIASRTLI